MLDGIGEAQVDMLHPAIAPDGQRVAVSSSKNGVRQVWVHQGRRASLLTEDTPAFRPEWHPDGSLYYATGEDDGLEIRRLAPSATGVGLAVVRGNFPRMDASGRTLWFARWDSTSQFNLWHLVLAQGSSDARQLDQQPRRQISPAPSSDGRFVAYVSDEGGRLVAYVRSASGGPPVRVTSEPVSEVFWRGDELFFPTQGVLHVAGVHTAPHLRVDPPRPLFRARDVGALGFNGLIGIDRTGQRFVVVQTPHELERRVILVENWQPVVR